MSGSKQSDPSTWNRPGFVPEGEELEVFGLPTSDEEVEEIFKNHPRTIVEPPASEEEVKEIFDNHEKHKRSKN